MLNKKHGSAALVGQIELVPKGAQAISRQWTVIQELFASA
jgi:hypothetical protein